MKKRKQTGLDFEVDKLTNSIENLVSGDSFPTDITLITNVDLKNVTKKNGWVFDWKLEFKDPVRDVYKLTITNNLNIVQGLISLEVKSDHVYMHLVESAPFNKGISKTVTLVLTKLTTLFMRASLLIFSVPKNFFGSTLRRTESSPYLYFL